MAGKRIGILGGTFDPVHIGHLAVAEEVLEEMGLDCIWFVPAAQPPHKPEYGISPFVDRIAMLETAVGLRPDFVISLLESELPAPSYTIDTLKELRRRLAGDTELFFIIGLDAFAEIATWKSYDVLLEQACFVVITRPSHDPATLEYIMASCFAGYVFDSGTGTWTAGEDSDSGRIYVINMKPRDVSSTKIRGLVREDRPVRGLVPRGVEDYIRDKGLYRRE